MRMKKKENEEERKRDAHSTWIQAASIDQKKGRKEKEEETE